MKQKNYVVGKMGEKLAENFLSKNGYKLIVRNFHTRHGEIDLIMSKKDPIAKGFRMTLIFVEVKLKVGEDFGTPEEMITKHKIRQIEMTGEMFLLKYPEYNNLHESLQIDAVCIVMDTNREVLRLIHYENIS